MITRELVFRDVKKRLNSYFMVAKSRSHYNILIYLYAKVDIEILVYSGITDLRRIEAHRKKLAILLRVKFIIKK